MKRTHIRKQYVEGLFGQMHIRLTAPEQAQHTPVLCLHVSPLSGLVYEDLLARIGTDRLAVAADTPGYGMSDAPQERPTITDYAKAFSHLIDQLGFEDVDLVGYATGSVIAAELARLRQDAVRRVVLFSAPVLDQADRDALGGRFGHAIEAQPDGSHLIPLWKQVHDGRGPEQTAELCMLVFPEHIRAQGERKPWAPRAAFEFPLDEALAAMTQPTVVYNLNNEVHDSTTRAAQHLNTGPVIDLPDWGHGFLQTRPDDTATLVRRFLDSDEPETGL